MSTPYTSSASQIKTAELCLRKWAFIKIDGLPDPPSKWAAFGTRTHKILEHWFQRRTPPPGSDEGKVAQCMIPHLPMPQNVHPDDVELHIKGFEIGGVPFRGYIDLFRPAIGGLPVEVYDHKTCGDFRWSVTEDDMHEDAQVTLYAYWAMMKTNAQEVRVQWTYGKRGKSPKCRPVIRTLTWDEIKPRIEKTAETVRHLKLLKETPDLKALDVPYDARGCEAFGGCTFKKLCNLSPQEQIGSIMAQGETSTGKNDFLAKLNARKAALAGNGTPATHPPSLDVVDGAASAPATSEPGINPPEPPADAAPPAPESKPKEKKKRKTAAEKKAEKEAALAAESARVPLTPEPPAVAAPPAASPAPAHSAAPPSALGASAADTLVVYRQGFLDGFKLGQEA